MNRRDFLKTSLAATMLSSQTSCAQSLISTNADGDALLRLNPYIQPKERVEKRVYDNSKPELVVWQTTTQKATTPPYSRVFTDIDGFIESLVQDDFIPVIGGLLVRRDIPQSNQSGFYFYLGTGVSLLKLPSVKPDELISTTGKYYYTGSSTQSIEKEIPESWISFDFREIKLISNGKEYKPTGELWRGGGIKMYDAPINRPVDYPSRRKKYSRLDISAIMRFDIPYRPLHFNLEIPRLIVGGVAVPMPTCFFEPFDEDKNKWVDS